MKTLFHRRTHVDFEVRHASAKFNQKYLSKYIYALTDLWLNFYHLTVPPELEVNSCVNIIPTLVYDTYVVINKENTVKLIRTISLPIWKGMLYSFLTDDEDT